METTKPIEYNHEDVFWRDFVLFPDNPYKLDVDLSRFQCLLVYSIKHPDLASQYYPTPIGTMASLVRMNHGRVKILIQDVEEYTRPLFDNWNLICFYPMAVSFSKTIELADRIKSDWPDSRICFFNSDQHQHEMLLCNPEARNFAWIMMKRYPFIDYILVGEAEKSLKTRAPRWSPVVSTGKVNR